MTTEERVGIEWVTGAIRTEAKPSACLHTENKES